MMSRARMGGRSLPALGEEHRRLTNRARLLAALSAAASRTYPVRDRRHCLSLEQLPIGDGWVPQRWKRDRHSPPQGRRKHE